MTRNKKMNMDISSLSHSLLSCVCTSSPCFSYIIDQKRYIGAKEISSFNMMVMYADNETSDPVYSFLSYPVHENLVSTSIEVNSSIS